MESLSYKPNIEAVVERLGRLYARQAQDEVFASFEIPNAALDRFAAKYPTPFCDYPDPQERVAFWRDALAVHASLEDDSLPCAYLSEFDQGLYGGLVGAMYGSWRIRKTVGFRRWCRRCSRTGRNSTLYRNRARARGWNATGTR